MKWQKNSYCVLTAIISFITIFFSCGDVTASNNTFDGVVKIAGAIQKYRLAHQGRNPTTLESLVPSYLKADDLWIPNADPKGLPLIRMVYLSRQGYRCPDSKSLVIAITSIQGPNGFYIYIDNNCRSLLISAGGYQMMLARRSAPNLAAPLMIQEK